MMRYPGYIYIILLCFPLLSACETGEHPRQIGTFEAEHPQFWNVVSKDALAERVGIDFQFTEGPSWHPDGTLIFSDIPANTIYQWDGKKYNEFRKPSGKSNGLLVDPGWAVIACEHESRSITRLSLEGNFTVLADRYRGKRFNSPNDLCRGPDGSIYFTDPPWGLDGLNDDPEKELPFNGVYRLADGEVVLLDSTLSWPNGIALSPNGRFLYVANFEGGQDVPEQQWEAFWVRYTLDHEGDVTGREVFFRMEELSRPGGPDGMKVDKKGNLFATGPGGILVISPQGELLGTIGLPEVPSNLCFGPRENYLYVTARSMLIRISLKDRPKRKD